MRRNNQNRDLETLEEREYTVTAEGIAVRTLPDHRSPRTGEILRQGDTFTAIETVDGEGDDPRLYLRLPGGRGWVFDDEKYFPGFPSVKLVSINGMQMEEPQTEPEKLPLIAVVGRPNVGKTTLVNKICDLSENHGGITWDAPGVTRDRTYKYGQHTDDCGDTYMFEVVDTGGLIFFDDLETVTFRREIKMQIDVALREAVACIFVVDSRVGCTTEDVAIARHLKENYMPHGMKVVLAVTKCDLLETMDLQIVDFWQLEMGTPLPVAAIYGRGVWEIVDKVIDGGYGAMFPKRLKGQGIDPPPTVREGSVSVAIVGKPNAGKSSLFNALVGEARSIVSDVPGTTTEAIDAYVESDGKVYRFIDTAGIRRTRHVQPGTEWLSVNRAMKAVQRADVALLVLDASQVMTGDFSRGLAYWCPDQQMRWIARHIEVLGTSCVIVLSKWDQVPNKDESTLRKFVEAVRANLAGVGQWAEIVSCSAVTGQRLKKILDAVDKTLEAHRKRIPTPILNEVVRDALLWRLPAARSFKRKQGRIYYCCQVASEPPVITIFCNSPRLFGPNYKTYIENKLRQDLGWFGTPIQLEWRKRSERRAVSTAEQWLSPRLQPAPEEVWR
jgi:GTP-binding protein